MQSFAGSRGATWLTIAMAISALGALHVVVLTGARIPYAMARDGVFFQFARAPSPYFSHSQRIADFPRLHRRAARPQRNVRRALFPLRLRRLDLLRVNCDCLASSAQNGAQSFAPLPRLGLSLTPLIFLIAAIALTANLWMVRPVRSSLGLLVILAGIPFFYHWRDAQPSRTTPGRPRLDDGDCFPAEIDPSIDYCEG